MDTATLRVTFGVVGLCVLVLCYGATYRSSRSAYSGWWCLSIAAFMLAALLFLFDGTALQRFGNPAGNVVGALGAGCVWASGSSLRGRRLAGWQLLVGPVIVGVVSALSHPERNVWAGDEAYFGAIAALIGLSARDLFHAWRVEQQRAVPRLQYRFALGSIMLVSAVIALFYVLRMVVLVAVGPDAALFDVAFGAQATTLFTLVLLVVVTFGMSVLSHEQQAAELREQATRDGMTGLLNRTEFLRQAEAELGSGAMKRRCAVVVADLDRFKALNDGLGHDAGDRAILTFAEVCRQAVGGDGIVGRLGGDEFALLLYDDSLSEAIVEDIAVRLAASSGDFAMPTASFGIASVGNADDAGAVVTRADIALYQAKASGRSCAVRYDGRRPATAHLGR